MRWNSTPVLFQDQQYVVDWAIQFKNITKANRLRGSLDFGTRDSQGTPTSPVVTPALPTYVPDLEISIAISTPTSDMLSDMGDDHYPILTPMEAEEALSQFPAGQEEPEPEVYNRGRRNSFDRLQEEWDYTQRMSKEAEDQDHKPSAVPCKPGPDDTIAITLPLKRKLIPGNLAPRFPPLSEEEIQRIKEADNNPNTVRSTKTWVKKWNQYKEECHLTYEDGTVNVAQLNKDLEAFIIQVKMDNGEEFRDSSLDTGFGSLGRYLKLKGEENNRVVNIQSDTEFRGARTILNVRMANLQKMGNGGTNAASDLSLEEFRTMLGSAFCSVDTPEGLLHRVYLYLSVFLVERRGEASHMEVPDLKLKMMAAGEYYFERTMTVETNHQGGRCGVVGSRVIFPQP
ncbi:uncharacterized protein EV422DRAFT_507873 [Fimicolochytrium jonesii]|uniref:uncharacterized protein n=1 Tax=Fimicolochytrium jonesii TaxID=1396493 RepID=UPI0022FEC194|nr:uncharacterized protein EV422DRAFT_507873 [Fimicolochytrium jonesii]KAI8818689.1 hypothetical protein EV422DRAFT_507873 [Fimicolochytrium jonesii]